MADQSPDGGMPPWVKLLLLAGAVLAVLVAVGFMIVGGDHGPSHHMRSGDRAPATTAMAGPVSPGDGDR